MTNRSPVPVPVSLYSDTKAFTTDELFSGAPAYPTVLANGHPAESRRAVSSPQILSAPLPSARKEALDTRSSIQRFGHLNVYSSDVSALKQLIGLYTAELDSLEDQLREAGKLLASTESRVAFVNREASRGVLENSGHQLLSAQAVHESIAQGYRGMQDRILQLKRLRALHTGLLHPIRKLPMELLMMIMQFAAAREELDRRAAILLPDQHSLVRHRRSPPGRINSLDDTSNPNESPSTRQHCARTLPIAVRMSQVCSYWRTTAHKIPGLWRTIQFRLGGQPDVGLQSRSMVSWFMEKARHNPTETPSHNPGMALVFTGWMEHGHPPSSDTLQKLLHMLVSNDAKRAPTGTYIQVAETPSHSRRYSDAPSTIELSLTPDSETEDAAPGDSIVPPGMPSMEIVTPESVRTFRIARLEIDFDELCEHEVLAGQSRNSQLHWLSKCPKPEEVVFIARDSVYRDVPHGHETPSGLFSPPYGKSLIPCAKEVTLCNLSYDWATTPRIDDPYSNLTSLKLIYTSHFDRLLTKPHNTDNLGFLQFLKVTRNLVDLEIRLPSASPISAAGTDASTSVSPVTVAAAAHLNGAPSISMPASLHRLIISLPDLYRIIPLFLVESSRPSAPTIMLPSLNHLSILPQDTRAATGPLLVDKNVQLIHEFIQTTEAAVTHLEFLHSNDFGPLTHDLTSASHRRPAKDVKDQISFILQQFDSCKTVEVWGNDNVDALIAIFGLHHANAPSVADAPAPKIGAPPVARAPVTTSSTPRSVEIPASKAKSEALRDHSSSPGPQSTIPSSSSSPNAKSPNKISKPRRSTPTNTQRRTSWLSTPKDIIAKIVAPLSRPRSLAIVETPVRTPEMAIDDLPAPLAAGTRDLPDPERLAPPGVNTRSVGLLLGSRPQGSAASSSRAEAYSAIGDEVSALASSVSQENHSIPGVIEVATLLSSVKKVIIHDGTSFTPFMAKSLTDHKIGVTVHG